jgi:predicted phosphoribosyltransferase
VFPNRERAGAALAVALAPRIAAQPTQLYGLARGGVLVARPIAEELRLPLDVLVACKVGAPGQPELAVGAVSEGGGEYWDEWATQALVLTPQWRRAAVVSAADEVQRRVLRYRGATLAVDPGALALVVDDGIATGSTVLAALRGLRALGAARVAVASPVASREALELLGREAQWTVAIEMPEPFVAVGAHYDEFEPVDDSSLMRALGAVA